MRIRNKSLISLGQKKILRAELDKSKQAYQVDTSGNLNPSQSYDFIGKLHCIRTAYAVPLIV